jgi:hypothetical protein
MTAFCEHGNESSVSITVQKFTDQVKVNSAFDRLDRIM